MNFTDYAEKAIHRYGLTGYNNLARELGVNKATVSVFRAGKKLPSEETMIKLAELAGMPKEEALIDLNLWRSKKNPELQSVWIRIGKMVKIVPILFVATSIFISDCKASYCDSSCQTMYIMARKALSKSAKYLFLLYKKIYSDKINIYLKKSFYIFENLTSRKIKNCVNTTY